MNTSTNNSKKLLVIYRDISFSPRFTETSADHMQTYNYEVDQFDAYKGQNHATQAPDQQIPAQERLSAQRPVSNSLQGDRDECHNNDRIENHRGQNSRGR